ncbi:ATP-binding cassette domain-containing protein [Pseudothioclava arenosa]|uniref:ABC transporter ATP-binding protein n=1 Tax=Pseudothioclava arenosa TaxID=1795308 RepID=A0A2A4CQX9_9RHOB|nr:ATP-binding cassette domain-containing protein [Pseudothioclava arenosa]PCD76526.1 ABC transporter ATP-binding protein [Pseudothioclava arenosa]
MSLILDHVTLAPPGGARLFAPLDVTIAPGEVLCVTGPSGIGKSSLIALIGGFLPCGFRAEGRVLLNGVDLAGQPPEARRIGLLLQEAPLFPHLSVGDNLAFALSPRVKGRAARRAAIEEALEQAALPGFAGRDPATLSGGQRLRVSLMRALLAEPAALLLDEPFSRLDPPLRAEFRAFVLGHLVARAIPALIVSHDAEDAATATRCCALAPPAPSG